MQAELEHRQLARQAMGQLNTALEDRKGGTKHVILEGPVVGFISHRFINIVERYLIKSLLFGRVRCFKFKGSLLYVCCL